MDQSLVARGGGWEGWAPRSACIPGSVKKSPVRRSPTLDPPCESAPALAPIGIDRVRNPELVPLPTISTGATRSSSDVRCGPDRPGSRGAPSERRAKPGRSPGPWNDSMELRSRWTGPPAWGPAHARVRSPLDRRRFPCRGDLGTINGGYRISDMEGASSGAAMGPARSATGAGPRHPVCESKERGGDHDRDPSERAPAGNPRRPRGTCLSTSSRGKAGSEAARSTIRGDVPGPGNGHRAGRVVLSTPGNDRGDRREDEDGRGPRGGFADDPLDEAGASPRDGAGARRPPHERGRAVTAPEGAWRR